MRELNLSETNNVNGAGFANAMMFVIAGVAMDIVSANSTNHYAPLYSVVGCIMGLISICCDRDQGDGLFN